MNKEIFRLKNSIGAANASLILLSEEISRGETGADDLVEILMGIIDFLEGVQQHDA